MADYEIGYGKPPASGRFKPGVSGNLALIAEPVEERAKQPRQFGLVRARQGTPLAAGGIADMRGEDLRHPIHREAGNHRQALGRQVCEVLGEATHCLGAVAREIVATLADSARRRGVDIEVQALSIPPVMIDRIQIEQVLVNLIRNAIEAMVEQDRGEKHIRVGIREIDDGVEVVVEDDGPGVSSEVATRLFEPFETSKRSGMGLGLWLSRELVHRHGGRLWWDPAAAVGARFIFRLPRTAVQYL